MVLGHRRHSAASSRTSQDEGRGDPATDDETVVDAEQGNVLGHIISQLRPGADLSRVTLPTFILEPRSMLERITNFMAHPELLLPIVQVEDPLQRFVAVTKFYLSGWHIKPPGVKKPLNPVLGETYTAWWDYPDNTKGYYISEQTSHHPPKSSYFFMIPEHHIRIDGTLKPRSKFLGNSAASMMEGIAVLRLLNRNEKYFVTQPNMYARGILFGKMKYELGDHASIRCPESGLVADLEFKTKGYFGGTYNAIGGFIKDADGKNLFELSGMWNGEMFIKDLTTGKKDLLFDATHAKETPPLTRPIQEQDERESQRLWNDVNIAIKKRDHVGATDHKSAIEDMQRQEAAKRADDGIDWRPRLFRAVSGGPGGEDEGEEDLDYVINAKIDAPTPQEQIKQILNIAAILPGQSPVRRFSIPEHRESDLGRQLSQHDSQPDTHPHQSYPSATVNNGTSLIDLQGNPVPASQPSARTQPSIPAPIPHAAPVQYTAPAVAHQKLPPVPEDLPGYPTSHVLRDASQRSELSGLSNDMNDLHVGGAKGQAAALRGSHERSESPGLRRLDSQTGDADEFLDAEA